MTVDRRQALGAIATSPLAAKAVASHLREAPIGGEVMDIGGSKAPLDIHGLLVKSGRRDLVREYLGFTRGQPRLYEPRTELKSMSERARVYINKQEEIEREIDNFLNGFSDWEGRQAQIKKLAKKLGVEL